MKKSLFAVSSLVALAATAHADVELGIDPSRPRADNVLRPPTDTDESEGYHFEFHGFLRVPMRVGIAKGFGDKHAPPHVPDATYTDWRYTNVAGGPWTELWLEYGNDTVTANVVLAAYDISDASYRDLVSQLGINQSFLTFRFPELFGEDGGLVWNVGAFSNRYGTAGRYDAGKYDTYLFGATHVAGETVSLFYDVAPNLTLAFDHGVGAKLQVISQGGPEAPYLPWPGPEQQGSTLLHHAHVGVGLNGGITAALHYLTEWTDDARLAAEEDGRISNVGADVKMVGNKHGEAYLGYSHIVSDNPLRVAGAFETLHSFEGWNLRDNYFGETTTGTGTIDTVMWQYQFSLARYLWSPKEFWGQGPDLVVSTFGMYNHVSSDEPGFTAPTDKLKLGASAAYTPKPWLAVDLRYDAVQPDMADRTYSFHVISPTVILRSKFASNEEVHLGYSHYLHGENVAPAYPNETLAPDKHLFRISAVMWW